MFYNIRYKELRGSGEGDGYMKPSKAATPEKERLKEEIVYIIERNRNNEKFLMHMLACARAYEKVLHR